MLTERDKAIEEISDKLSPAEASSPAWFKISAVLAKRLKSAQSKLEGNLTFDETNRVRGQILELKYLLKLSEEDPDVEIY